MSGQNIVTKFFRDPTGAFFNQLDNLRLAINRVCCNIIMKSVLALRGIKYGPKNDFYGIARFRRHYMSSIIVGNNCRFRSSFLSNNVGLNRHCFLSTLRKDARLVIGNHVGMSGTVIGCAESISIGNNVLLGGNTFVTDFDWHPLKRDGRETAKSKPVIIEDDAFLGMNVIVLKGTHIGKGSVIGANSVVTGIIPSGVIAGGNPCKVIKPLT
jgi:acetyltransferase-like isoleucine patch superfamily enzyme